MLRCVALFCLVLTAGSLLSVDAWARTWTDRSGKFQIEANLVTVKDGKAYLERTDGQVAPVELSKLCDADLQFISTLAEYKDAVTDLLRGRSENSPTAGNAAVGEDSGATALAKITVPDEETVGEVRTFQSDSWGYSAIAFSPSGAYIAVGVAQSVMVYDVDKSEEIARHEKISGIGQIGCVAFSPDGKTLMANAAQGKILVWSFDPAQGLTPEKQLVIHSREAKSLAIAPDNDHVLSMDADGNVKYWSIASGEMKFGYGGFRTNVATTFISRRGGQGLASDGRILSLFDIAQGKALQSMPIGRGIAQWVAISRDGSHAALNDLYAVRVFQTRTGKEMRPLQEKEIQWSGDFSPNGGLFASGGNGRVTVWSIDTGRAEVAFPASESGYVKIVKFTPDGMHVAAVTSPIGKVLQIYRLPKALQRK